MNSMTGFGKAEIQKKTYKLQLELSSVNSRYLEVVYRMPRQFTGLESKIKELIGRSLSRGKITVSVNFEESPESLGASALDPRAAEAYYKQLVRLKRKLNISGEIEMKDIVAHPEILAMPNRGLDEDKVWSDLRRVLTKALADLKKMRAAEGANLKRDMKLRLTRVGRLVASIQKQAPKNVIEYKKRLEKRIHEMGSGIKLDPDRLATEVTIFADRSDVTEECIRLLSHIDQLTKTLRHNGDSGKRLNFIIQEMGREANTIGSKSISTETSARAIAVKEEIEKLREQVQNIE